MPDYGTTITMCPWASYRARGYGHPPSRGCGEPPADAYWQWAQVSPAPLVTVTTTLPLWPRIAIAPAAVAKFKYPAECVAHKFPGHPNKGSLYYSLGTAGTIPAELGPALRTRLREHHGSPLWPTPAIAMPACVVPASTAATVPRRVAGAGRSWNQMPGLTTGASTCGGSVARPCGARRA